MTNTDSVTSVSTWPRYLFATLCGVIAAWFLFELFLAVYISPPAVALYGLILLILVPPVRRKVATLRLLRRCWFRRLLFLTLLLVANGWLRAGDHAPMVSRVDTAYVGATILTGHAKAEAIEDGVVLVDADGFITAVGTLSTVDLPADYEVVDLSGRFLLPGLINAHDHLMMIGDRDPFEAADFSNYAIETPGGISEWILHTYPLKRLVMSLMERNAVKALSGGVTTVRELATVDFLDVDLRKKIERGQRIGPRILAAGPPLCITGGHGYQLGRVISGPIDARNAVREAIARGVDVIKITSTGGVADSRRVGEAGELQMTPEEIRAVTDEAHRRNILVTAHVESRQGVLEALRAGVDNIEHGASLDPESIELFLSNPHSLRGYSTLHPTLSVLAGGVVAHPDTPPHSRLGVINSNAEIVHGELIRGFQDALANGVHIAVGTDAGVIAHDSVWAEMQLFIEHGGVSNEQAIHMGTLATARSIGIEAMTGSVEVGKAADLLVVSEDPREDIGVLATPYLVVAQGAQYQPQRNQ